MKILKNINVLYFIFIISIINIGYYVYCKKYNSILLFATSCLVVYLINKNMIIVLGISIVIINLLNVLNLVKENFEGFDDNENIKSASKPSANSDKNLHEDIQTLDTVQTALGTKLTEILDNYEDFENKNDVDLDIETEESTYMQDKTIMKKLKNKL